MTNFYIKNQRTASKMEGFWFSKETHSLPDSNKFELPKPTKSERKVIVMIVSVFASVLFLLLIGFNFMSFVSGRPLYISPISMMSGLLGMGIILFVVSSWIMLALDELKQTDQRRNNLIFLTAHKLRSPISTSNLYSELLMRNGENLTEEQNTFIKEMRESNQRIIEIVNNLEKAAEDFEKNTNSNRKSSNE